MPSEKAAEQINKFVEIYNKILTGQLELPVTFELSNEIVEIKSFKIINSENEFLSKIGIHFIFDKPIGVFLRAYLSKTEGLYCVPKSIGVSGRENYKMQLTIFKINDDVLGL